jgi:ribosomal protein S27AE
MKYIKSYENKPGSDYQYKHKSLIDPSKILTLDELKYTEDYIEEDLTKHWYAVDPDKYSFDKISCPLCKIEEFFISHGKNVTCPRCKLQIKNYGNSLECKISKEKLNYYNNIINTSNKFNI